MLPFEIAAHLVVNWRDYRVACHPQNHHRLFIEASHKVTVVVNLLYIIVIKGIAHHTP